MYGSRAFMKCMGNIMAKEPSLCSDLHSHRKVKQLYEVKSVMRFIFSSNKVTEQFQKVNDDLSNYLHCGWWLLQTSLTFPICLYTWQGACWALWWAKLSLFNNASVSVTSCTKCCRMKKIWQCTACSKQNVGYDDSLATILRRWKFWQKQTSRWYTSWIATTECVLVMFVWF